MTWNGLNVSVTGHNGFKGTWLQYWLKRKGANIQGISLPRDSYPNLFDDPAVYAGTQEVLLDIADDGDLSKALNAHEPALIFHLAAQPLVRRALEDPVETFRTNVLGTLNVLKAGYSCKSVRAIIVVTSDKCYLNRNLGQPFVEEDMLGGEDIYSASKACAEILAASWRSSYRRMPRSPLVATARAGNVIGPGDWAKDRIVPDLVRAITAGRPAEIRNPNATRPWQHVLDPLAGYVQLAEQLLDGNGDFAKAWNFGPESSVEIPVAQFADRFCRFWGEGASWTAMPEKNSVEAKILSIDSTMSKKELNWRPRLTVESAIKWTATGYKSKDIVWALESQIEDYDALTLD